MEILGWVGSICFCLCALPQAIYCWRHKTAEGLSWWFLWMWFVGEIATFIYVFPKGCMPLLVNYVLNFILLLVIMYYKFKDLKIS